MSGNGGLPKGWKLEKLKNIVLPRTTVNPAKNGTGMFRYVDIDAIDNINQKIVSPKEIESINAPSRARLLILKGDILFSLVRPYLKNIALVTDEMDGEIASTAFCVLRPAKGIYSGFLFFQLIQESFINSIATYGNSPPAARDDEFVELQIKVAPEHEQRRIVAKIEELFSSLDAGIVALERAKANLKRYRASVLKAAVEGKLTEQWRKEHPPTETASRLLERILHERRRKWEEEQLAKYDAQGKTPPKGWKEKYKEPVKPDTGDLPELPEGWCWASIEQLAAHDANAITDGPFGSNLKTAHYTDYGPRVIRLQNIKDGYFSDDRAHISEQRFLALSKHRIEPGDIVIAGLSENPPRACIIPDTIGPAIVKADCIRFKPHNELSVKCLNYFLNSFPTRLRMQMIVHGVGRPRLNLGEIKEIHLPIPPLTEQAEITSIVETQISIIENLESELDIKSQTTKKLRQSILNRAFTGRLVPQDPNDEPAEILLERIRAEKAAQSHTKAPRKAHIRSRHT